jgi:hypothetical protein
VTTAAVGSLRCSAWARTVDLDPGGTAGSYSGFLLVDAPLPWPRDAGEIDEIATIADLLAGSGLRLQAMVPADDDRRRVALYQHDRAGPFRGYTGRHAEFGSGGSSLREAVAGLLAGDGEPATSSARELLMCTHGRRDVCCGALGTELHGLLSSMSLPDGVTLGRTSHTGGHRFAPTFIVLPEGTVWAFADVDLVMQVLSRTGDASAAADHYRGCAGLSGPQVQVLEREVLRRTGWELFSCARSGSSDSDGSAWLEVAHPDDGVERWEAQVVPGRHLPVPDCGRPVEEAKKSETEWEVLDVAKV